MLYKVTPMLPTTEGQKARSTKEPGQPRKRRKTAIYDADGNEVLITLMCLKCKSMRPLAQFGLRKMSDGAIRNQPWCRLCRGASGAKKKGPVELVAEPAADVAPPELAAVEAVEVEAEAPAAPAPELEPAVVAPA